MTSEIPVKDRYYEDFAVGESFTLGSVEMVEKEMIEFATQFDPQRFHIDPDAAAQIRIRWPNCLRVAYRVTHDASKRRLFLG